MFESSGDSLGEMQIGSFLRHYLVAIQTACILYD